MKKHKDAINKIRIVVKGLAEEKAKVRSRIQALKFNEHGERRPETGGERSHIWQSYKDRVRWSIRAYLLAYGLLRGVPYRVMEPKSNEAEVRHMVPGILKRIHEALEKEELKAEWTADRILELIEAKAQSQEAA